MLKYLSCKLWGMHLEFQHSKDNAKMIAIFRTANAQWVPCQLDWHRALSLISKQMWFTEQQESHTYNCSTFTQALYQNGIVIMNGETQYGNTIQKEYTAIRQLKMVCEMEEKTNTTVFEMFWYRLQEKLKRNFISIHSNENDPRLIVFSKY